MEHSTKITKKQLEKIEDLIEKVLSELSIDGSFTLSQTEDGLSITLTTDDSGLVIGYHGEGIESLQLLLSLMIAKELGEFVRISFEVGDYKKTREEYLRHVVEQTRDRVLREQKEQALVSLKAWERRFVHMLLKDDEEVASESMGEGRDRVVVIRPR